MSLLVGAASNSATGYTLNNSLRFRSSASAYLGRTPSSGGNQKTWTFSCWTKRGALTGSQVIFGAANSANSQFVDVTINGNNVFELDILDSNSTRTIRTSTAVLRDPSAWYHIVLVIDTTQATDTDRIKLYVNNELLTTSAGTGTYPALNADTQVNATTGIHAIARRQGSADRYYDGYITEINLIDGTALTPSAFGETDDNGTWVPKKYTGTYGTNGFYLDFEDTSSVAALGTDSSGNSNTWTVNNVSLTAGATYDSMTDVPTLTDEDTSNYPVINELASTFFNTNSANLQSKRTSTSGMYSIPTSMAMPQGDKWYAEFTGVNVVAGAGTGYQAVGICDIDDWNPNVNTYLGTTRDSYGYFNLTYKANNAALTAGYGASWTTNDVIGVAVNLVDNEIEFFKNGASQGVAYTNLESDRSYCFALSQGYSTTSEMAFNAGQRPFSYTPPSGFKKLNTFNLPDSTIEDGSTNFKPVLYTGNASTQSITGLDFSPDLTWIKVRNSASYEQMWFDSVRGVTKYIRSNTTAAEGTVASTLTSFDSNGFSLGNNNDVNGSGFPIIAWNWNTEDTTAVTYTVKVVSDSGNKYRFDDFGTSAVTLNLHETGTYTFDQSDSSNSGHPLRFSATSDGTHGGGSEYTTGVTVTGTPGTAGAKTVIVVAASAPTLYYYCSVHSGMGGQANTNVTKGSSNFAGTIASTVSANTTAGFSIVTYGGNSTAGATVGHGLGVVPDMVIVKNRTGSSGFQNWGVYRSTLLNTQALFLNTTGAVTANTTYWNNTTPTASVFSLGYTGTDGWNITGQNFVAYCFADVEGYSKFGSYTGNGNANGAFVYTGFRPAFVLIKVTSTTDEWVIYDTARDTYNVANKRLNPNSSGAEQTTQSIDILSNGFKPRSTGANINQNAATYIYMAVAENPFKNSTAR